MKNATSRWEPQGDDDYESASAELKERFATWAADKGVAVEPDAPEGLLHYKWGYIDGHLTRWTRRDLSEIYLELYPAKVIAGPDELDEVLAEARAFVTFLSETALLDEASEPAEVLVEHLGRIEGQFRANMADPSRYSFGKRLWTEAAAEGVRPDDRDRGRGLHREVQRPAPSRTGRDPRRGPEVGESSSGDGPVHSSGNEAPALFRKATQAPALNGRCWGSRSRTPCDAGRAASCSSSRNSACLPA